MVAEKIVSIDFLNPLDVYGANNTHLDLLKKKFPKIKIVARGELVKLNGEPSDLELFEQKFLLILNHIEKYGKISETNILQLVEEGSHRIAIGKEDFQNHILVHGKNGMLIKARTINQFSMVESSAINDLIFAIGPAGSGKTYTAVALAVRALKNKEIKKIILTRPAVEAGENLGFLPGDMKEKLDPYLQPLYDALKDMIPPAKLKNYLEDGTIEIAPLAFMRGRTLDNAFAILDEAQNATENQLKMFLTRMGKSAKFFVTGDITQIDLPRSKSSGLFLAIKILKNLEGIDFIYLNETDIVRHKLVSDIVKAYAKEYEQNSNK
ncbi:MAG: phosphate starvation-inducible protein PhoH [Bacteroidetes bacterium CG2_30_32_10]|nr:MAG: phosphate starvation-inducible protein PhoH [Bacteroidetes bacterium CG2_30_32_10]